MAYNIDLAKRVRTLLTKNPELKIEEKKMFGGHAFMVNGKMCVNVSGENLMCRFDPDLLNEVSKRNGYQPMIMSGRIFKGYCYVSEDGFTAEKDFLYWINICLDFNDKVKSSKKKN
ncbi:MAG: TfoX/Sxy family protein [Chitinophagales bacterium]|nr:TfoX/Sxy family protein [Bacteroidota bacterium]MBP7400363.1 TfoX/Sxy family protein [Chitinophagales bacterium]